MAHPGELNSFKASGTPTHPKYVKFQTWVTYVFSAGWRNFTKKKATSETVFASKPGGSIPANPANTPFTAACAILGKVVGKIQFLENGINTCSPCPTTSPAILGLPGGRSIICQNFRGKDCVCGGSFSCFRAVGNPRTFFECELIPFGPTTSKTAQLRPCGGKWGTNDNILQTQQKQHPGKLRPTTLQCVAQHQGAIPLQVEEEDIVKIPRNASCGNKCLFVRDR